MTPSQLYAKVNGFECKGWSKCHWCGTACDASFSHDAPSLLLPGPKEAIKLIKAGATHPNNPWTCKACHYYRNRGKHTLMSLSGSYEDGVVIKQRSWLLTDTGIYSVLPKDNEIIFKFLLNPQHIFVLSLIENPCLLKHSHNYLCSFNQLHLTKINLLEKRESSTPLHFTLDNIPMTYTIYELDEALKSGDSTGTEPGVQALIRYLGSPESFKIYTENGELKEKRPVGRPPNNPPPPKPVIVPPTLQQNTLKKK